MTSVIVTADFPARLLVGPDPDMKAWRRALERMEELFPARVYKHEIIKHGDQRVLWDDQEDTKARYLLIECQ